MKVKDLIKELEKLDPEKEILVSMGDDMLGYYSYKDPFLTTGIAMKYDYIKETKRGTKHFKGYEQGISNWTPDYYEEVEVYVIE